MGKWVLAGPVLFFLGRPTGIVWALGGGGVGGIRNRGAPGLSLCSGGVVTYVFE